ncbi:MAG: hypothetical protein NC912_03750 [Candidatus Omnitrophica bacterium]|nr:hypothetical protein [Candidatus Omnitrophota bacterium]
MRIFKKDAQTTIEYVMVITLVIAVLISMFSFLSYLSMGRLQAVSDYVTEKGGE